MKKLQNNFTTPEQSKRLLYLGVPADSADCYYSFHPLIDDVIVNVRTAFQYSDKDFWQLEKKTPRHYPCWSVGRLIEIYNTCVDFDLDDGAAIVIFIQESSPIEQIMKMFEDKVGIMAFSNLEE